MSIFDFQHFKDYLAYRVRQELYSASGRKRSSLARFSKSLGYSGPSLISMVLRGKRIPSDELCDALATSWKLNLRESEHLRLLVQLERRRQQGLETEGITTRLKRLSGKTQVRNFGSDDFAPIREWYFVVIKQLVQTPGFTEDATWISKRLRRRITPAQAQRALNRLEELGHLERDPESGRLRSRDPHVETTHDIPSGAIREHHEQMLIAAQEALKNHPVQTRLFNSLTLNVAEARVPELRAALLDFVRKLNADFSTNDADGVHQINLQFFEHTQSAEVTDVTKEKNFV
jgi:uncharacterized protein (TIGR02147 family)